MKRHARNGGRRQEKKIKEGTERNQEKNHYHLSRAHLPFQTYREKRLGGKVRVVALRLCLGGPQHLHTHKLEALVLEAGDNGGNEAALHAIGLDGDEGALLWGGRKGETHDKS